MQQSSTDNRTAMYQDCIPRLCPRGSILSIKKNLTSAHVQVLPIKAWDKNYLKFLDIPFLPLENNYKGSEPHQRRQCRPFSCAEQNLSGGGRANAIEQNVCLYDSDTLWTENILHSSASVIRDQPKSFILQKNPDNSTSKTKSNTVKKLSNGKVTSTNSW